MKNFNEMTEEELIEAAKELEKKSEELKAVQNEALAIEENIIEFMVKNGIQEMDLGNGEKIVLEGVRFEKQ